MEKPMSDTKKIEKQFQKAVPLPVEVELGGQTIVLETPNFRTLAKLEEALDCDWDAAFQRIDIRDRDAFIKIFTIFANQHDSEFTEEKALSLLNIKNMWVVLDAMQQVILNSQPDPDFLTKMKARAEAANLLTSEI